MIERRNFTSTVAIEQRDNQQPTIKGTASPTYDGTSGTEYNLYDNVYERFLPGAFDRALSSNPDVVALFNHKAEIVLGRTPNTLKLRSDSKGLHYEIAPDMENTQVRDVVRMIGRGDVRHSSFAFTPSKVKWRVEGDKEIREIHEANLFDVSPVTHAAYSGSSTGLRSTEERNSIEKERQHHRDIVETERILTRYEEIKNQQNK
jgi:HK97 family phage prohead protease